MAFGNGRGQWVLVNMSPKVAYQLENDPQLDRHPGLADADVRAVVLTDPQIDQVGGLLSLRDGAPIDLYATPAVFDQLTTALPVLPVLQHYCGVHWQVVPVAGDRRAATFRINGLPSLEFTAVATEAAAPRHLAPADGPRVGDSIALAVLDLDTGQRVFCVPGLPRLGAAEYAWMQGADCLLMAQPSDHPTGHPGQCGGHTAARPVDDSGTAHAWLTLLQALPARHKVVFGAMPGACTPPGITLAHDGLEIEL